MLIVMPETTIASRDRAINVLGGLTIHPHAHTDYLDLFAIG